MKDKVLDYLAGTALADILSFILKILPLFLLIYSICILIYFIFSANSVKACESDCRALWVSENSIFSAFAISMSVS